MLWRRQTSSLVAKLEPNKVGSQIRQDQHGSKTPERAVELSERL